MRRSLTIPNLVRRTGFRPSRVLLLAPLLAILAGGCSMIPGDIVIGRGYEPENVYVRTIPSALHLRRVAVLPLAARQLECQEMHAALERELRTELGKARQFELVPITPEKLKEWTGQSNWTSAEQVPVELLDLVKERFGCDGVLFPEVTQFHAYPPVVIGWNLRLVDVASREIVWAVDEVFDSGDRPVSNAARRHQKRTARLKGALNDSRHVLISPGAFGRYTAEAVVATLPPRDYSGPSL